MGTSEMYNSERKERYLSEIKDTYAPDFITNIRSSFNRAGPYEEAIGKDLCNFSREEISNFYSLLMYSNKYVYSSLNSRLRAYTEWCLNQTLVADGCNHYQEFNVNDFESYVNKRVIANKYISRESYLGLLNAIPNPRDQFLVMCLWEFGRSPNFCEIFGMKLEDIDEKTGTVTLTGGRIVKVSAELIAKAVEANGDMKYLMPGREVYRNLLPSPYIFKRAKTSGDEIDQVDNGNQNVKMVARIMKNLVDYCGANRGINAAAIAVSGQLDMIHRRAADLGITEKEFVMGHFDELTKQYRTSPGNAKGYWEKHEAYL